MQEPVVSVLIVEDEKVSAETLQDLLETQPGFEDAEVQWYDNLELVHRELLDGYSPTWAFVDIQLRTDRTGGLRVLELLRGLSPETRAVVTSVEASAAELRDKLAGWPFVYGVAAKGRLSTDLPPILEAADEEEATDSGTTSAPTVYISDALATAAHSEIGIELHPILKAAFPLDETVRVVTMTSGRSGAAGFGVLVTSGKAWRSQHGFYFLKVAVGDDGRDLLQQELDNYRLLWRVVYETHPKLVPHCFGMVAEGDVHALLFEYVGVVEGTATIPEHWRPTHLDGFLRNFKGDINNQITLESAYSSLGALLRLPSIGGMWPGDARRQSVHHLCEKAAKRLDQRLENRPPTSFDDGSPPRYLREPRIELEECALVGRESIPNPVYYLHTLEVEISERLVSLGPTHGDLHCRNLVRRTEATGSSWMLIDFGHCEVENLQLLDAARLECDLLLEKLPLLPLAAMVELAEGLLGDMVGVGESPPGWPSGGDRVGKPIARTESFRQAVYRLRVSMGREWAARVRAAGADAAPGEEISFERQYLYALLYESVRWMTHEAGLLRFLHRLFFGALVCEALAPTLAAPLPTMAVNASELR